MATLGTQELWSAARRRRFAVRMLLGSRPGVYRVVPAWNWLRARDDHVLITSRTRLVIDGFPGSGNSFSIAALEAAAESEGRGLPPIAHHLHCPGQVLGAVRRGIPVLLLVREPTANAVSALARWPHLTAPLALASYARYHKRLRGAARGMQVATFEQLTGDFGAVTRRLNERFGADLPVFDHAASGAVVYSPDDEARAARRALATARRREVDDPALAGLRAEALEVYEYFATLAQPG